MPTLSEEGFTCQVRVRCNANGHYEVFDRERTTLMEQLDIIPTFLTDLLGTRLSGDVFSPQWGHTKSFSTRWSLIPVKIKELDCFIKSCMSKPYPCHITVQAVLVCDITSSQVILAG